MTVPFKPEEYKLSDHEIRENIIKGIIEEFGISREVLESDRRYFDFVRARQAGMYLMKKRTKMSLPRIGQRFGNRDHTTVMHAVKVVPIKMDSDSDYAASVNRVEESIPKSRAVSAGRDVAEDVPNAYVKAKADTVTLVPPQSAMAAQ